MIDWPYWFHKFMAACQGAAAGWVDSAVLVAGVAPATGALGAGIFLDKSRIMDHAREIWA